jgi:hypothetical protein
MFSARQLLIWVGGIMVAGVLAIFGVFYLVNHLVAAPDLRAPLAKQGGLKPQQDFRPMK